MKFVTESKNRDVQKACTIASEIINDELFWESLPEMLYDFSNNGMGGKVNKSQLKNILQNYVTQAEVKTFWRMRNPFTGAIVVGQYSGGKIIQTNTNACPTVHHFVGNLCHEWVHLVDNFVPEYIGHLDNNPKGKENSAPYFIGRAAKAWSEKHYGV